MIHFEETATKLVVVFSGRLDTLACQATDEQVLERVRAASGLVEFDLAEVEYVASVFLRICLQTAKIVGPGRFSVVRVNPVVKKVFKIAGIDSLLAEE